MATSDGLAPKPVDTHRSATRVVLVTLGAVAVALLLLAGGAGGYIAYHRQTERNADLRAELTQSEQNADAIRRQYQTQLARASNLAEQLAKEKSHAQSEYLRGRREGSESEQQLSAEFGLDYDGGYNAAFAGFGGWEIDSYYVIFVEKGEGKQKYNIASGITMEPCESYIFKSGAIFTRDEPC